MTPAIIKKVQQRCLHAIGPHTAAAARCSFHDLQQFAAGMPVLNDAQVRLLMTHFGLNEKGEWR